MHPLEILARVAAKLQEFPYRLVYVGGATVPLYLTDPAPQPIRATDDVDIVVEVRTHSEYQNELRAEIVRRGGEEDDSEDAPLGRFVMEGIKVDVMSPERGVLGVTNRWYEHALQLAEEREIEDDLRILVAPPPCFLATKIEAYRSRGADALSSRDMEDIVVLLDGRPELAGEIARTEEELRDYLVGTAVAWLADEDLEAVLSAHLAGDELSQERAEVLVERLHSIAALGASR